MPDKPTYYEQPVSERMRTFMRLEFLYQQMLYNSEQVSDWATRATISSLLEIMAILSRGDVRSEVHKELDQQLTILQRLPEPARRRHATAGFAGSQSDRQSRRTGQNRHGSFLQPLKDSDFLNAIKNRSAIPGRHL